METKYVDVKTVCDWIRNNPYTEIISGITDVDPTEIEQDFLNYIDKSD